MPKPISISWFFINMFKFVVFLTAVACILGAVIPEGMLPQLDGRIVGGTEANIIDHPWQVSVQHKGFHFCGGSIYSATVIVTSARCLQNATTADDLKIRAGSPFWYTAGSLINVTSFVPHEKFNNVTWDHDIGLLNLTTPLTFNDKIKAIPLATTIPQNGAAAVVTGWGTTSTSSTSISGRLRQANVNFIRNLVCSSDEYGYGTDNILPTMVCAAAPGKDSCKGDTGGPLVSGGVLAGVVSWGYDCADPNYPGVYANVAPLANWVVKTAATFDKPAANKTISNF